MVVPHANATAIVVGGGGGECPGGVSKVDLMLGGERLIDRVYEVLLEACDTGCVAVAPPIVRVPDDALHTLEDPPSGGSFAGIGAGLRAPGVDDDVPIVVVSVDTPGVGAFLPVLPEPALREGVEGRIVRGGDPEPFDQYLMGVYWTASLHHVIDEAVAVYGSVRGVDMRRVLRALDVERASVSVGACRDIDTPEDAAWWETFLSS